MTWPRLSYSLDNGNENDLEADGSGRLELEVLGASTAKELGLDGALPLACSLVGIV
jgi:hypothetical protein